MNKKIPFIPAAGIIALLALLVGTVVVLGSLALRGKSVSLYSFETPMPKPEISETADWQTYTNEAYGYEISYPNDWLFYKILNEESIISFVGPDWAETSFGDSPGLFRHAREDYRIDIGVMELTNDNKNFFEEAYTSNNNTKNELHIGVEGYPARDYQGVPEFYIGEDYYNEVVRNIFLYHGSYIYYFTIHLDDPAVPLYDQMISTFRFID